LNPSIIGFAIRNQSPTGAVVWEKGETGPRVKPFDLFQETPSGNYYISFENYLFLIDPNSPLFNPITLKTVKKVPETIAKQCYPKNGPFDPSATLYKVLDKETNQLFFFLFVDRTVRAISNQIVASCRFNVANAKELESVGALHNIAPMGVDVHSDDSYIGSFKPIRRYDASISSNT